MAPLEFYRYQDARGDTIIYKFDPSVAKDPHNMTECPISIYHHYRVEYPSKVLYHSDLVPLQLATERWKKEKLPQPGIAMHTEFVKNPVTGALDKVQYVWKGWEFGNDWGLGWVKIRW